ncbi:hypothetical protein CFOLD11_11750 [Clostridium folliculivorans]|uniref:Dynamin family protein n=1 Tax=Clostridium folliculivorans TaxID=2886038 RepID=A0A9W5Y0M5_9CLOT|nr:dynamin family protein [Clostridium folliculivorans]GKU24349.1 hypothetical protein CFOLD11_11750 [Clostridium folliculivorans]
MINELKNYIDKIVMIAEKLGMEDINRHFYDEVANIKVYFHGGYDYGKKSTSPQRLIFSNKEFKGFVSQHRIRFEELNVALPYNGEQDLLLTVFGDEEIEGRDKKNLNERRYNNYPTLPLIIFTEDFFRIPYGEVLAYASIIETLESCCEYRVVAFNERDVRSYESIFSRYLYCVSFLKRTIDIVKIADETRDNLHNLIFEIYDENDSHIDLVLKGGWIKQISEKLKEIESLNVACNSLKDFIFQQLFSIQEENKNNVLRRLRYFKANSYASTFAKDILLKYGTVIEEIDQFTDEVSKNQHINSDYQIVRRMEATRHYLEDACEFATIGTFSSGKTTFINTLLASNHKLRTSAAHNTAVLLKIHKDDEVKGEYSKITFKDKIELDLIEPASTNELAQLYRGQENGRVISVDRINARIKIRYGNRTSVILIENEKTIIVTEGQILKPNDKLTEGFSDVHNCRKVKCVSRDELLVLIDELNAKRLSSISVTLESENKSDFEKGSRAIGVIKALLKIANNTESTIDIESLKEVGLENCHHIKLTAEYNKGPIEIKLDNNGWRYFSDNVEEDVYIERPECYIFAKEIDVFMKSSFLQYCTIIDTPGFGSVTEKHDAISERYLMEHNGILLIMIKISNATEKLSMRVLLNKVEAIYNNNSNLNKKNVTFILNCFANSTTEEHLISACRNVSKMIVDKGFSKDKIFVCNLKRSIENNEYLDRMFDEFPSYKMFASSIKREIEEKGMLQKFIGVKDIWDGFFESKINELTRENSELKNDKRNRERIVSDNEFALGQTKNIQMLDFYELKKKYMDEVNPLLRMVDGLSSKKEWKQSKDDIFVFLDTVSGIDDYIERDYNKVYDIASKAGIRDIEIPQISNRKKFIVPSETFKDLYNDILYRRSWGLFWHNKHRFQKELYDFLTDEIDKSFEIMEKEYYKICSEQFAKFKKYCIAVIMKRIEVNKDDGTNKYIIESNEILNKEYRKFYKSWSVLSSLISKMDDMRNNY